MHLNKKPLIINDPEHDERFKGVRFDESVRSLVAVPMMVKSALKGILAAYNKKDGRTFTEEDQRLLAIIAAQSAQVVENARLYEEEQALLRMREEVRLAARIQIDLLPKSSPEIKGYDIAGRSVPAQMVGGDYFDFIPTHDYRLAISVGDVSGKGLPASLLMASLQATLRAQTFVSSYAKECVRRSNRLLFQTTSPEKFVTLFYAILDPKKHELSFCNAGHNYPLLFSSMPPRRLETGGTVLGIMEDFPYLEDVVTFNPGDILVIYSDGITEAINDTEEQFGEERLLRTISENKDISAEQLVETITSAVRTFVGGIPQADDMTLVVVRRTE